LNHYSNLEKQQAMEAFATLLLIERDRMFDRETKKEVAIKVEAEIRRRSTLLQQRQASQQIPPQEQSHENEPIGKESFSENTSPANMVREPENVATNSSSSHVSAARSSFSTSPSYTGSLPAIRESQDGASSTVISEQQVAGNHAASSSSPILITNLARELIVRLNSIEEQKKNAQFLTKNSQLNSSIAPNMLGMKLSTVVPASNLESHSENLKDDVSNDDGPLKV
jgi:hypothetical protein